MHLMTTNPVSGVWRQNTRAGIIPAISFTRLSRRNARISVHAMRMRTFLRMRCECAHFRACDANARIFVHAMWMLAYARISPHAMWCDAMRMRASRGNLCVSDTVWVHRMVYLVCDCELWLWPWILKAKFKKSFIIAIRGWIDMEPKECESIGCWPQVVT